MSQSLSSNNTTTLETSKDDNQNITSWEKIEKEFKRLAETGNESENKNDANDNNENEDDNDNEDNEDDDEEENEDIKTEEKESKNNENGDNSDDIQYCLQLIQNDKEEDEEETESRINFKQLKELKKDCLNQFSKTISKYNCSFTQCMFKNKACLKYITKLRNIATKLHNFCIVKEMSDDDNNNNINNNHKNEKQKKNKNKKKKKSKNKNNSDNNEEIVLTHKDIKRLIKILTIFLDIPDNQIRIDICESFSYLTEDYDYFVKGIILSLLLIICILFW